MDIEAKPMRTRKLLLWGVSGQLVYVLGQFFVLLALTRFATVEEVGAFGLAASIVLPIYFFFSLNLRSNVATIEASETVFNDFRALLMVSMGLGYVLLLMIGLSVFSGPTLSILLIFGLTKVAESYSELCYGLLQREDQMPLVAKSLILRSLISAALFTGLLWNGFSVPSAFFGQMIVWFLMSVLFDHRSAQQLCRKRNDFEAAEFLRVRRLAQSSLGLGANGFLAALQANMPRYVIANTLGVGALGYFTVVGYAMQAISTVMNALTQSLIARLAQYLQLSQQDAVILTVRKIIWMLLGFSILGVFLSLHFGDAAIQWVFGPNYNDLGTLLAVCILAASLQSVVMLLQTMLIAGRQFNSVLKVRLFSTASMLVVGMLGATYCGLIGVAWAMTSVFTLHGLVLVFALGKLGFQKSDLLKFGFMKGPS